jgi:DNA repair exonuclease SbcCD ATPase subunit
MRNEFEAYVKKLTTAICKDIFLEKLEELCKKYEEEYKRYSKATNAVESAGKSLIDEVDTVTALLNNVDGKTNKSIVSINKEISKMEENTKQLFSELKTFNDRKSEDFIKKLANYIEGYNNELEHIFERGEKRISDKLAGVITPKSLQDFMDSLQKNTQETKKLASFVNENYKKEVEKSIKEIVEANSKAMKETDTKISAYVKEMTDGLRLSQKDASDNIDQKVKDFEAYMQKYMVALAQYFNKLAVSEKDERNAAIEEQKSLISQIGPSDEKMNELEQRVARLEKAVNDLNQVNDTYHKKYVTILERLSKKQEDFEKRQRENVEQVRKEVEQIRNESNEISQSVKGSMGIVLVCAAIIIILEIFNIFGLKGLIIVVVAMIALPIALPRLKMSIIELIRNRRS